MEGCCGGNVEDDDDWFDKDDAAAGIRKLNAGRRSVSLGALASPATLSRMSVTWSGDGRTTVDAAEDDIVPSKATYARSIGCQQKVNGMNATLGVYGTTREMEE